eukprot:3934422-Rhodomonas_salina.1
MSRLRVMKFWGNKGRWCGFEGPETTAEDPREMVVFCGVRAHCFEGLTVLESSLFFLESSLFGVWGLGRAGQKCDEASFDFINSCEYLAQSFECKGEIPEPHTP